MSDQQARPLFVIETQPVAPDVAALCRRDVAHAVKPYAAYADRRAERLDRLGRQPRCATFVYHYHGCHWVVDFEEGQPISIRHDRPRVAAMLGALIHNIVSGRIEPKARSSEPLNPASRSSGFNEDAARVLRHLVRVPKRVTTPLRFNRRAFKEMIVMVAITKLNLRPPAHKPGRARDISDDGSIVDQGGNVQIVDMKCAQLAVDRLVKKYGIAPDRRVHIFAAHAVVHYGLTAEQAAQLRRKLEEVS
jgi:hypothetical protein